MMTASGKTIRLVNVVPMPTAKIKKEVLSDEEEGCMKCLICSKTFFSAIALRNHAMMEHFEVFITGNPDNWTDPDSTERTTESTTGITSEDLKKRIAIKKEQVVSSMKPGNLVTLASEDVNYIIIKDEIEASMPAKKKRLRLVKVDKPSKEPTRRKELVPPTGPFECIVEGSCHRIFFSCCEYSIHYRDEHTRRRKGLRCQVCEKALTGGEESEFPYNCDVCGSGFYSNKDLSEHTSVAHVKLKPFQCAICFKRFTQQGGVQQHMRMHTGDRPFTCSVCTKSFTQKSGLDQHMRIHTKVKPYRCVVCGKTFCQSVHLKQHMRTHTQLSPFTCPICGQKFKQSSHLTYHLKNHQGNKSDDEGSHKMLEQSMIVDQHVVVEHHVDIENTIKMEQSLEDQLEQVAAEQSIQLVEETEECVLSDGTDTWTVQIVEG